MADEKDAPEGEIITDMKQVETIALAITKVLTPDFENKDGRELQIDLVNRQQGLFVAFEANIGALGSIGALDKYSVTAVSVMFEELQDRFLHGLLGPGAVAIPVEGSSSVH